MTECEKLPTCAFLKKYLDKAPTTIGKLKELYCMGPKLSECARLAYIAKTNEEPPAELMPNGKNAETGQDF
ncbi:MAG: hypothetical protein K9W43_04355 [Candidatus Thorarchaeota archaeon]|nr:hypothetical protein [Candidatus Thorarchaeota archaeon]